MADWTEFDRLATEAAKYQLALGDAIENAMKTYGGNVWQGHRWMSGGFCAHWPEDVKQAIRDARHKRGVAKDAALSARPKRTRAKTALARYNKIESEIVIDAMLSGN